MPAPAWFYPLPKAIPTFHPSALPSRRWGGGGWREEGSSGTIQRGLVMVTQRWPGSALFPTCWEHRCNLGWDFHPPLNHFSIIPCLPRALRPARTPSCPSIGVFWGAGPGHVLGCGYQDVHPRAPQILVPPRTAGAAALPPPHSCVTVGPGWVRRARRAPHIPFLPHDILGFHLY